VEAGASGPAPSERSLGGPKQRLVLALLLAEPNVTVSVDRLIDGVWGEDPPDSARHTLQSYVSELRKSVGEVIERDGIGYRLRASRADLDALDFEARVSEGLADVELDPERAVRTLEGALALWRGRPYEGHPDQPSLHAESTRLEELRLEAIEGTCRGRLALGQPAAVLRDLERLTSEHPYREELRALQMLALYRSGRQADALRVFQGTRTRLAEDLGIEPSPRLRRLEEQILLQDPDLDLAGDATTTAPAPGVRVDNPYMGLRAFREGDASRFYGQDRLVASLMERLEGGSTFTALVGPSGSGKSSAVQAGLLPRVRAELPSFGVAVMQPGVQPFAELETALAAWRGWDASSLAQLRASDTGLIESVRARAGDAERLLLVVDQFEEVFTLTES
jgi:DNA-binding SARP family transcriptional activator